MKSFAFYCYFNMSCSFTEASFWNSKNFFLLKSLCLKYNKKDKLEGIFKNLNLADVKRSAFLKLMLVNLWLWCAIHSFPPPPPEKQIRIAHGLMKKNHPNCQYLNCSSIDSWGDFEHIAQFNHMNLKPILPCYIAFLFCSLNNIINQIEHFKKFLKFRTSNFFLNNILIND